MGAARRADRITRARALTVGLVLILAWVGLGIRLFQVQVVRAAELSEASLNERLTRRELAPDRGTIFDRDGGTLAVSILGKTVAANPRAIADVEITAQLLSAALDMEIDWLRERLSSDASFVFVKRQLEPSEVEAVIDMGLPGIFTIDEPKRVYPAEGLAAHVVGFVDIDSNGLEGLEFHYDEELRGEPGYVMFESDLRGRRIPQGLYETQPAVAGSDLRSTIDPSVQFIAENACADALATTGAQRCTIVVMDPETGEVLALVAAPAFNPADRSTYTTELITNSAIRTIYEPGSTQKLVTLAAALEEGAVTPRDRFLVHDSIEVAGGQTIRDFNPHEPEYWSVNDILTFSSNVGTILIQRELGDTTHRRYIEAFGYGEATGIDANGEEPGLVNLDPSCGSCFQSAAIGYSLSVTPLQIAAVYATIANDGVWIEPHLVSEIIDGDGTRHHQEPEQRQVVSAETAATLRGMLARVVEEGTGSRAQVPGYRAGGKTGTTQAIINGEYSELDVVASFVGMAPIDDPQLVVAVVIDRPYRDQTGGRAAAPVFATVMEQALHSLGVQGDVR